MDDKRELINNEVPAENTAPPPMYTAPPPNYPAYNTSYYPQSQAAAGCPPHAVMVRHAQAPPKDYMVMAILVTVFCCLPFGIVGIIKASEAKDMYAVGSYAAAEMASQSAGKWSRAGLIFGAVSVILCTVLTGIWIVLLLTVDLDDDML